ncbi:hypothetical protein [Catenuloplanes japonicus]|uniref:hypothetical protein n=1 Tax=Catenuloplanes japonicus TaxID=33876 RepID=UPI00068F3DC8|nr:hypothetical protein [Catenuloplanes japonicus]
MIAVPRGHTDVLADQEDMRMDAFDASYAGLYPAARTCYHALGLHPGPDASLKTIAAALDTSLLIAERHVKCLIQARLVAEAPAGRYRMTDQVHQHARVQAGTAPDAHRLIARISEWYLAGTRAADAAAAPFREQYPAVFVHLSAEHEVRFPDQGRALAWLEAERENLLALADAWAAADPHLVWLLIDSMWALFMFRRRHDDRAHTDALALDCAQRTKNPTWIAHAWRRLAWSWYGIGNLDGAADAFGNAVTAAAGIDDENTQVVATATAQEGLAAVAQAQGDHVHALELLAAQRGLHLTRGDDRREGLSALRHAVALTNADQPAQALPVLHDACTLYSRTGGTDPYNAARISLECARALARLGRHDAARTALEAASQEMNDLGRSRDPTLAQHYLADLARARGDLLRARIRLEAAAPLYTDLGNHEEHAAHAALAALDHAAD